MLWMSIWMCPHHVTATHADQACRICMMLQCHGWGWKPSLTVSHIHIGCIQSVWAPWDAVDGHIWVHPYAFNTLCRWGWILGKMGEKSLVPGASSSSLLNNSRLCKIYSEYEECNMQYVKGGSCRSGWVWINVHWLENPFPRSRIGYPIMCFKGGFEEFLLSMN